MKKEALWKNFKMDKYPKLTKNMQTDILIVGGGLTGGSLFYQLRDDKRKVTLVERSTLGMGATGRSSAKITFLQENIYTKLANNFDEFIASLYYESQKLAIEKMKEIIKKEKIDCDFKASSSYLYTLIEDEVEDIKREKELLSSFKELVKEIDILPNGMKVKKGFYVNDTYVFHPLKYLNAIAKKGIKKDHEIYENTNVINVVKKDDLYYCYTKDAIITCKELVIATHYPNFLVPFLFPIKCYLEKSYILAKKEKDMKEFNAINISNPIYSIRYYNEFKLVVGASHNLCIKNNDTENVHELQQLANIKNPTYIWSNHDIMTLDDLPYIGVLKEHLYLATGYNTWGMTNATLASLVLYDLLNHQENRYSNLLSLQRGISKVKIIKYPLNIFSNVYSYMHSKINVRKKWYHDNPYFTKFDGKNVAIYKDKTGKEHIVYIKCPHLKCNLIFNRVEETWDCPCHGSRFTLDGKCIMGPSNYDISYRK